MSAETTTTPTTIDPHPCPPACELTGMCVQACAPLPLPEGDE